jgi:hypothetical protein
MTKNTRISLSFSLSSAHWWDQGYFVAFVEGLVVVGVLAVDGHGQGGEAAQGGVAALEVG